MGWVELVLMITANYHTHTFRCQHASGDVADYCATAVDAGLTVLGMSDHTPLPDGRWPQVRMTMDELPDYMSAIDRARESVPELTLLRSMECEYTPDYVAFYEDVLLGQYGCEYLIGAVHFFPHKGEWERAFGGPTTPAILRSYTDYMIKTMDSGLFAFQAHPDVFANAYLTWDAEAEACSRAILDAAVDLSMPLEVNAYGFRKPAVVTPEGERAPYPLRQFWELASEYDISVTVNSDAHRPEDIVARMDDALALVKEFDLTMADFSALVLKAEAT